jgi:hypothetical protein
VEFYKINNKILENTYDYFKAILFKLYNCTTVKHNNLCPDILTVQHTAAVRVFESLYLLSSESRDSGWDVAVLMTKCLLV